MSYSLARVPIYSSFFCGSVEIFGSLYCTMSSFVPYIFLKIYGEIELDADPETSYENVSKSSVKYKQNPRIVHLNFQDEFKKRM